ncbi:SH3 domain-containing protein [Streptomyces sp. NPDC090442]|uniref:SH3 domain-containing protein n=1 Tax=Streptomyces sp. NPDC090442 TaxID=3365962 RepID=UPI003816088C
MSTTDNLVARGKKLAAGAGALTTAVALGATLLVAAPAQAKPHPQPRGPQPQINIPQPQADSFQPQVQGVRPQTGPGSAYGTVSAGRGMNEREYPSTDSASQGYFRNGTRVYLVCKVRAQNIRGNDVWYLIRGSRRTWISAKHVANTGFVKYCNDGRPNRVKPSDAAKHAG